MSETVAQLDLGKGLNSLGSRFAQAREARGIPLDKAAHDTRIRTQRLREIENDDLSHFAHPSYARMFLSDYARYLDIPFEEIKNLLPAPGAVGIEGYQYLQGGLDVQPFHPLPRAPGGSRRRMRSALFSAVTVAACVFLAFQITLTVRKLDRVNRPSSEVVVHVAPAVQAPVVAAEDRFADVDELPLEPIQDAPVNPELVEIMASVPSHPVSSTPLFIGGTVDHGGAVR